MITVSEGDVINRLQIDKIDSPVNIFSDVFQEVSCFLQGVRPVWLSAAKHNYWLYRRVASDDSHSALSIHQLTRCPLVGHCLSAAEKLQIFNLRYMRITVGRCTYQGDVMWSTWPAAMLTGRIDTASTEWRTVSTQRGPGTDATTRLADCQNLTTNWITDTQFS